MTQYPWHKTRVELPWPDPKLNPNSRAHWSVLHRLRKTQREFAYYSAKNSPLVYNKDRYTLKVVFHPPDKRRRDEDNFVASMKAAFDGLAMGWGVDDSQFSIRQEFGEIIKGGLVVVEVVD